MDIGIIKPPEFSQIFWNQIEQVPAVSLILSKSNENIHCIKKIVRVKLYTKVRYKGRKNQLSLQTRESFLGKIWKLLSVLFHHLQQGLPLLLVLALRGKFCDHVHPSLCQIIDNTNI
jgi:hypothetical protein